MTDIRRTVLIVVFTMSLVLLWDAWNRHTGKPTLFSPKAPAAAASAAPGGAPPAFPAPAQGGAAPAAAAPTAATAPAAPTAKQTYSTDVFNVTIDARGADIAHVELRKYRDQNNGGKPVVLMDESPARTYLAQTGYISTTAGMNLPNHYTVFQEVPGERALRDGSDTLTVRYESPDVGGAKLVKTYTFKRGEYTIGVKHELVNTGSAPLQPQLYLQLLRDGDAPPGESMFYYTFTGPAVYTEKEKFQKVPFKDIEKHATGDKPLHETHANTGWVAMVQHYFASAWLAPDAPREFRSTKVGQNRYTVAMVLPQAAVAPGATQTHESRLYVGPQEEYKLEQLAPGLDLVKDYGWFTILAKPLFWLLDQLYRVFGNWGWAIVGLVVLLKIAFYGLNASAYKSMAKMKAVNPRIMEMRERLKDKPQQMQQEMMRIYKEEKINPLGSCLPIFLQMPFFIALYWVLLSSVEMRNAPWVLWITDLSAIDPYFILPTLMTASSLLQVWLNPTPPDPMQAKLMWLMPLLFSIMFFFFPAGLVLYWLTNNLLSIAQQWMINKKLGVLAKD